MHTTHVALLFIFIRSYVRTCVKCQIVMGGWIVSTLDFSNFFFFSPLWRVTFSTPKRVQTNIEFWNLITNRHRRFLILALLILSKNILTIFYRVRLNKINENYRGEMLTLSIFFMNIIMIGLSSNVISYI